MPNVLTTDNDQVNLYAYVGNDPVNGTDPDGLQVTPVTPCGTTKEDAGKETSACITIQFTNRSENKRKERSDDSRMSKPWSGSCDRAIQEPGKIEAKSHQISAVLGLGWSRSWGEWRNIQTGTWGTYTSSNFSAGFDFGVSVGPVIANRLNEFAGFGDSWSVGVNIGVIGFSYGKSYDLQGNSTGYSRGVSAGGYGRIGASGSFGETVLGRTCHYRK